MPPDISRVRMKRIRIGYGGDFSEIARVLTVGNIWYTSN
jgi:hypothetical protein